MLAVVGKASPHPETGDIEFYLRDFESILRKTGKFVYAWTFNPDTAAVSELRSALDSGEDVYLYLPAAGGLSPLRMHVINFQHDPRPGGVTCPSVWIDHCIDPLQDQSDFGPALTQAIHLWFLLDSIERVVPPVDLRAGFYPALASKYAKWGQSYFAFLRPRTVVWTQKDDLDWQSVGHGLLFFASEASKSNDDLIAVVQGYGWLHERPRHIEAEIRCPDDSFGVDFLAAARTDIEPILLGTRELPGLRTWVSPRIFVHANA